MSLSCAMKLVAIWASIASAQYDCCIDGQCPYKDPLVPGDCFQTPSMIHAGVARIGYVLHALVKECALAVISPMSKRQFAKADVP